MTVQSDKYYCAKCKLNDAPLKIRIHNITARALVDFTGALAAYKKRILEGGEDIMKKKILGLTLAGIMALGTMTGCGSVVGSAVSASGTSQPQTSTEDSSGETAVLRVGMECAYAPFNWTQDADTTPYGS